MYVISVLDDNKEMWLILGYVETLEQAVEYCTGDNELYFEAVDRLY